MKPIHLLNFLRYTCKAPRFNIKRSVNNIMKIRPIRRYIPKLLGASVGAANVINLSDDIIKNNNNNINAGDNGDDNDHPNNSDFHAIVAQNLSDLETKTSELINTLHTAITETSEKYRQCLEEQITIYELGEMIDENNRFWDKLIENRGEAATLKQKLQNYIDMVQYVGKTVENVILLSTVMKKEMVDVLKYFELRNLAEIECVENKNLEKKLLKATMKNIVHTKP